MTDSTERATPPKSNKSRNSHYIVKIQINSTSQFQFVSRDTEESKFLDSVDSGNVVFSVNTVIHYNMSARAHNKSASPFVMPITILKD